MGIKEEINLSNSVELLGHYGSDIVHAQSAWTSTSRDLTEGKIARIDKLLNMLASEGTILHLKNQDYIF